MLLENRFCRFGKWEKQHFVLFASWHLNGKVGGQEPFFWQDPQPCKLSELPRHQPSHEYDMKKLRAEQKAAKLGGGQASRGADHGPDHKRARYQGNSNNQAGPRAHAPPQPHAPQYGESGRKRKGRGGGAKQGVGGSLPSEGPSAGSVPSKLRCTPLPPPSLDPVGRSPGEDARTFRTFLLYP